MQYVSTNDSESARPVDFREAVLDGLAPDGGLYVPSLIHERPAAFWATHHSHSAAQIAHQLLADYVSPSIDSTQLEELCDRAFSFDFPLVEVSNDTWALELFHGPTLAFKDVGARFLAECMSHFSEDETTVVLVATSGDTGSAVANGFLGVAGVETVILYPEGKVSPLQEKQFASLGQNTHPIAVQGTFDDCQRLVKHAFSDADLRRRVRLSSANSINVARWLPQSVYFAYAASRLDPDRPVVFSVPSGNFGNITAGIFASRSGLAVRRWIAALNANDVVERYLRTGNYQPQPSRATIANAMDVGNPSNLARLQYLFGNNFNAIVNEVDASSFSDEAITEAIKDVHREHNYLLDPHGATGWLALQATQKAATFVPGTQMVFVETAHPAKFGDALEHHTGLRPELPERLAAFADRSVSSETLEPEYDAFRGYLTSNWQ